MKVDRTFKLSEHFTLGEFVRPEVKEINDDAFRCLKHLAGRLEEARKLLGNKPIKINSGYRTKEHNAEVGGVRTSFHLRGMAADIEVDGITPKQVQNKLKDWNGGMGCYTTFTHLDTRLYKARW